MYRLANYGLKKYRTNSKRTLIISSVVAVLALILLAGTYGTFSFTSSAATTPTFNPAINLSNDAGVAKDPGSLKQRAERLCCLVRGRKGRLLQSKYRWRKHLDTTHNLRRPKD